MDVAELRKGLFDQCIKEQVEKLVAVQDRFAQRLITYDESREATAIIESRTLQRINSIAKMDDMMLKDEYRRIFVERGPICEED